MLKIADERRQFIEVDPFNVAFKSCPNFGGIGNEREFDPEFLFVQLQ